MSGANWIDGLAVWLMVAGLVVVVGSVFVMDWIAWFARRSGYWTETAIRAHKVTKPLDWVGALTLFAGGAIYYRDGFTGTIPWVQLATWVVLCLNGAWLSFVVSPELLRREQAGRSTELLPTLLQRKITFSFVLSFVGWWTQVTLLTLVLFNR